MGPVSVVQPTDRSLRSDQSPDDELQRFLHHYPASKPILLNRGQEEGSSKWLVGGFVFLRLRGVTSW